MPFTRFRLMAHARWLCIKTGDPAANQQLSQPHNNSASMPRTTMLLLVHVLVQHRAWLQPAGPDTCVLWRVKCITSYSRPSRHVSVHIGSLHTHSRTSAHHEHLRYACFLKQACTDAISAALMQYLPTAHTMCVEVLSIWWGKRRVSNK
jgi:hypothetical protein